MTALAHRVRRTIADRDLFPPRTRVLVSMSGGPDSTALLHVLRELEPSSEWALAGVAHLNHQIRGRAAVEDAEFCRTAADRLGLPFFGGSADVPALARSQGVSLEQAGRMARYRFLSEAAVQAGATCVALGHTRDDQAETMLLKLFRGAGARGLGGIYPRRGIFVRPLLNVERADLVAYLEERQIAFRVDETNHDVRNPRNYLRHQVLPLIADRWPGLSRVMSRQAQLAQEDAAYLDGVAADRLPAVLTVERSGLVIQVAALLAEPMAIRRRLARMALVQSAAEPDVARSPGGGAEDGFIAYDHVEDLLRLLKAPDGTCVDLPRQRATRRGEGIVLRRRSDRMAEVPPWAGIPIREMLPVPGEVALPALGWSVAASRLACVPPASEWSHPARTRAAVSAGAIAEPLGVRTRRPGDALQPLGLGGRKKLQDDFVDRKVGRAERDHVPLVVDARDRIVWVVGGPVEHNFRVTESTRAVILLTAKQLGGLG